MRPIRSVKLPVDGFRSQMTILLLSIKSLCLVSMVVFYALNLISNNHYTCHKSMDRFYNDPTGVKYMKYSTRIVQRKTKDMNNSRNQTHVAI